MNYKDKVIEYIKKEYGIEPTHPFPRDNVSMTFRDNLEGKWFALYMEVEGKHLGIHSDNLYPILNVKGDPDFISFICGQNGFLPAYHMNKKHWLTILLDGTAKFAEISDCIDRSYNLIVNTPTRRIYEAVKLIPRGRVATYGQVAEIAGDKKMARAVGNALHKNPDPDSIPCYRVVNAKGELAGEFAFGGAGEQAKLLEADGIEVIDGNVDLKKYGINLDELNKLYTRA